MPMHTLKERTYLDAKGKATTDESKGVSLLGITDDEITAEQAHAAGLVKTMPEEKAAPAAKMLFYNAEGKKVPEGSSDVAVQFLADDPNRPDAGGSSDVGSTIADADADEEPAYDRMKKAELRALADERELDVPADAKVADLVTALEQADADAGDAGNE